MTLTNTVRWQSQGKAGETAYRIGEVTDEAGKRQSVFVEVHQGKDRLNQDRWVEVMPNAVPFDLVGQWCDFCIWLAAQPKTVTPNLETVTVAPTNGAGELTVSIATNPVAPSPNRVSER